MEVNKKIFIGFVIASSIYFSFKTFKEESHLFSSHSKLVPLESKSNPPFLKIAIAALHTQNPQLNPYASAIQNQWKVWLQLNPSILFIEIPSKDYSLQDRRTIYFQESNKAGVDYILSGRLILDNGQKVFQPQLYSKQDEQIYKEKNILIRDMTALSDVKTALDFLLRMVEKNSYNNGKNVQIEDPNLFLENWNISSDSWERTISLYEKKLQKVPIESIEWEELAKRESNFWLPWEELILARYSDKPESFDLRYLLETFPTRYSNQFNPILARLALKFAESCLLSNNRYQATSLMEVASGYFTSSNQTYTIQYADFLSTLAKLQNLDKDTKSAQLSLLNAQKIYQELGQLANERYIENQIELAKIYFQNGWLSMSFHEMEESTRSIQFRDTFQDNKDHYNQARAFFNLGTLSLMMGKNLESLVYLEDAIAILQANQYSSSELMIQARTNLSAAYIGLRNWNLVIYNSKQLLTDLSLLEMNGSEWEGKNLFNLAVAYSNKGGVETAKSYLDRYNRITAYSKLVSFSNDKREYFSVLTESQKETQTFLPYFEEKLIRSYTGKYRIDGQSQEIRSRTYMDRLEDHDIFMENLLSENSSLQPSMYNLRSLLEIPKQTNGGENVVFVDIGPALGNLTHPAITSMSISRKFPNMQMVLIELPSDVDFFLQKTEKQARENIISNQQINIIQGDGTNPLNSWFQPKSRSAWVLKDRRTPTTIGKWIIIRAANSIDIYEPTAKIFPFLQSLVLDYDQNHVLVIFNKSIFAKPKGWNRLQLVGSFASRGYYHNSQSLDRQGEPAFQLNSLPLRRRFSPHESF